MAKTKYDWPNIFTAHRGKTARQIADILGVHPASVHHAAKKHNRILAKHIYPAKRDYTQFFRENKGKTTKELAAILGVSSPRVSVLKNFHYPWDEEEEDFHEKRHTDAANVSQSAKLRNSSACFHRTGRIPEELSS